MAGLDFDSTLNNDKLKKGLEDMKQMIKDGVDGASESGKKLSRVFSDLDSQGVKIGEGISRGLSEQATGSIKEFTSEIIQNIGIQKEVIAELDAEYKKLESTINNMDAPGVAKRNLMSESNKIKAQIDAEKKSLSDLETVYKSFRGETGNLQTKIRNLREEMASLDLNNQADVQRYRELSKEAQGYQSTLNGLNREIMDVGKNRGIEIAVGSLNVLSGAMTTATGIQALFAKDNERLQELMVRLQSVMSVSIGIQQLTNTLNKESNLIVRIKSLQLTAEARAQDLATKGTIRATIAQRAFNLVAKANPYVLIAGVLLSVVGAFALFSKGADKAIEKQKELNKRTLELTTEAITPSLVQFKKLQIAWDNLGGSLEKQTKFVKDNKDEFKGLGISVDNVNTASDLFTINSGAFIQSLMLRAKASAAAKIAEEKYEEVIRDRIKLEQEIEQSKDLTPDQQAVVDNVKEASKKLKKELEDRDLKIEDSREKAGNKLVQMELDWVNEANEIIKSLGIKPTKDGAKIRQDTLEQALKKEEQIWRNYYDAVDLIGEGKAKDIYGNLINVDSSFLKELQKEMKELMGEDSLTQKQVEQLNLLKKTIDDLNNKSSPFEKQKEEMQDALKSLDTYTDKIGYLINLRSGLGDSFIELELKGDIEKELNVIEDARQQMIDNILEKQQTYEEQSLALTEKYNDLKIGQSAQTVEKLNKELSEELTDIWFSAMGDDEEFRQIFIDMGIVATDGLEKFRELLIDQLNKTKSDADKIKIGEFIKKIDDTIKDRNPFKVIADGIKAMGDESIPAQQKLKLIEEAVEKVNEQIDFLRDISGSFRSVFVDLGADMDSALGDVLDSLDGVTDGVEMAVNGIASMAKGLAPGGNPLEAISGAMGVIGGAVKGISSLFGGGSAERAMKRWQAETERLKKIYEQLNYEISKALGDDIYAGQINALNNLYQQLDRLKERLDALNIVAEVGGAWGAIMTKTEREDLEEQIEEVERLITEMLENIEVDLAQTQAIDFARQLGDALVDAFERGESSVDAMNDSVDNMFRNMIRQAVNIEIQKKVQEQLDKLLVAGGYNPDTGEGFDITNITEEDLNAFKEAMGDAEDSVEGILELLDIIQGTDTKGDALAGAIQGMSQETAGVLAGQFNAIRIHVAQIVGGLENSNTNNRNMLASLSNIEIYTRNLIQMRQDLSELNSKVSNNSLRGSGL